MVDIQTLPARGLESPQVTEKGLLIVVCKDIEAKFRSCRNRPEPA